MKILNRLFLPAFTIGLLVLSACGGGSDPMPETERVKQILTSDIWNIQSVTVNSVDQTNQFTGLTLSFTSIAYSTTNGRVIWPASGTWEFTDASAKEIVRNDGLLITINEITDTSLELALTWSTTTLGGGRTASVAGDHEFSFIKN